MLLAPTEDGFRGRHLRLLSSVSMDSVNTMKNRSKEWSQCAAQDGQDDPGVDDAPLLTTYPHASVLRLRVVQIVCGISAMVMGTVGFIEERGRLNLGLGIPAGLATVLAAAVSIHLSRSFAGPGLDDLVDQN
ncbi:uncharacterized protein LOC117649614 [Thrips palmi]|uniref:Uncharacterized protein LOC117649614 n=1 Tax=Thrips palmi TaxID=161013 RepID=A0A6P8ZTK1_THRPL|nr:uncharacterized protein LOC117649614 [Thrips palmi]